MSHERQAWRKRTLPFRAGSSRCASAPSAGTQQTVCLHCLPQALLPDHFSPLSPRVRHQKPWRTSVPAQHKAATSSLCKAPKHASHSAAFMVQHRTLPLTVLTGDSLSVLCNPAIKAGALGMHASCIRILAKVTQPEQKMRPVWPWSQVPGHRLKRASHPWPRQAGQPSGWPAVQWPQSGPPSAARGGPPSAPTGYSARPCPGPSSSRTCTGGHTP